MFYLIDGYNLLYAMGIVHHDMPRQGLEKARQHLLDLLRQAHDSEPASVTVVFDAAKAPPGAPAEIDYHGIHVLFAIDEVQADDLIEQLIKKAAVPRRLTVISNDRRIKKAARRRGCAVLGCGDYLLGLEEPRRPPRAPAKATPAKPVGVSQEEREQWVEDFADLADSPEVKELFDPYGFLENEGR